MKKETKKDLQSIFHECISELKALGIAVNDETSLELICKTERIQDPVYLHFFDDRTELTVSEKLLSFPLDIAKAEIIRNILSIDNGRQIYGKGWLEKAAKVQRAYGYDMLNELDEDNLNGLPVIGILRCKKCGSRYELRGTENYNDYLDHGCTEKQCRHCGSSMWPDMQAPADGEPDLQALLEECLTEVHAAGIKTNPIRCIRWKKHSTGSWGQCCDHDGEFEILINEIYRKGKRDLAHLKETMIHEILHTCDRCQNHGQEFWDHAKKMDEMYGYHIFSTDLEEEETSKSPLHHPVICPNCGIKSEINSKDSFKMLKEKKILCQYCLVPYVSIENYEQAAKELLKEKNLQTILEECTVRLKELGIPISDRIRIEWVREYIEFAICKKEKDCFLIQISDQCKQIQISTDDLRDMIIHQMLHTCDGCDTHSQKWVDYAKQVDAAFHYQVSVCKSNYEYFHHDKRVRTFMKCHKCGALRTVRDDDLYDSYSRGEHCTCDWCGSQMLLIDKKRSKVHNLNKLLKQCIGELEAIEIYAGKIVNIIYVFLGKDYGECIPIDDDKYEIQIPYEYRKNTIDEKRLKALIIHQILHTCTESGKHNRQWMVYAREIEEAYGYEILRDCPFDPLNMWKVESVYKGTCPNCGCRVEIKGERNLAYILNHHKRFCSFCSADLEIMENVDAATRMRLNHI